MHQEHTHSDQHGKQKNKQSASGRNQPAHEFHSIEEMIRFDQAQTDVPCRLKDQLATELSSAATARRPWWRRIFSRRSS